jgi:hypothetical protein
VVLLGLTMWAGRRARRRFHYASAALTVAALAAAIVQAERLGRGYEFPVLRLQVHLGCAFAALGCLPLVALSGWRLRTRPAGRRAHRLCVAAFVGCTVLAILTACWMLLPAEPRAA